MCRCECGWPVHTQIAVTLECPKCSTEIRCEGREQIIAPPAFTQPDQTSTQRAHWNELHRHAEPTPEWFASWQIRIPNINCDCRRHWRELVEQSPPDFSSREAFFAWTVAAHNAVNQRLDKPIVTLEEARRLHAPVCVVCGSPATTICSHTLSLGMCGEPLCGDCTHQHAL